MTLPTLPKPLLSCPAILLIPLDASAMRLAPARSPNFAARSSDFLMYAKYVEYIKKSLDRAAKLGDLAGANRIAEASKGMSKIAGQLKSGLGRVGKVIQKARRMVEWIEAAR